MKLLYRSAVVLPTSLALSWVAMGAAHADDGTTPVVLSDLSPAAVSALLGLILPLIVALLTKYNVAPGVRIWMNLLLSAAASVVGTLVAADGSFAWVTFILSTLTAFLTSALAYVSV